MERNKDCKFVLVNKESKKSFNAKNVRVHFSFRSPYDINSSCDIVLCDDSECPVAASVMNYHLIETKKQLCELNGTVELWHRKSDNKDEYEHVMDFYNMFIYEFDFDNRSMDMRFDWQRFYTDSLFGCYYYEKFKIADDERSRAWAAMSSRRVRIGGEHGFDVIL